MITRDALYEFVGTLIENAAVDTPLYEAEIFRNLRTSVDEAVKVIRVECFTGQHALTDEERRKELVVRFTVQCWVLPTDDTQEAIDTACDESFEMSRTIFVAIAGEANLGSVRRGVTYLDGIINNAS
jgi:hypothetical protein